jgi:DivIVA domain-containing protein
MQVMEVTPKTLREVEFREKMRGYHPEDVDHFLEEVAAGLELQQERLRQAVDRAQRAEAAASEAGGNDETLRKTLVLAQRTADLAVQEAREQGARIVAGAEQQAQAILADADERGRRTLEDAVADARTDLARLESSRAQAQQDVDTLNRWLDEHKAHLLQSLSDAMSAVERCGVLWPSPSTRSYDLGHSPLPRLSTSSVAPSNLAPSPVPASPAPASPAPTSPAPANPAMTNPAMTNPAMTNPAMTSPTAPAGPGAAAAGPRPGPAPEAESDLTGPDTAVWSPAEEDRLPVAPSPPPPAPSAGSPAPAAPPEPAATAADPAAPPDDQALDDFFDDSDELGEDRRFGGRLRRRR